MKECLWCLSRCHFLWSWVYLQLVNLLVVGVFLSSRMLARRNISCKKPMPSQAETYSHKRIQHISFIFLTSNFSSKNYAANPLLPIPEINCILPNVDQFSSSFTSTLSSKHVMNWPLKIPPHLKCIAVKCKCQESSNNLKAVSCLTTNSNLI